MTVCPDGQLHWPVARIRGNHDVLCGTAKSDVQVMIVGIDNRCAPGEVGQDVDGVCTQSESPGLSIVRIGRKRSESHIIAQFRPGRKSNSHRAHGIVILAHAASLTALRPFARVDRPSASFDT
jgi:hypothetical protein